jgi:hypothetical protein
MSQSDTISALNELLALCVRSFPMYLRDTGWTAGPRDDQIAEVFRQIAADQTHLAGRVVKEILASGGNLDDGEFPMEFTELHDLSSDYLLQRAIEYQRELIDGIASCVTRLRLAPAASPLAEEALGLAKGHLESLQETVGSAA